MSIVVTGAAGFIGMHVAERLLSRGEAVIGIDNLNASYDPGLKQSRLSRLQKWPAFRSVHIDLTDAPALEAVVREAEATQLVHFAAQAGVRQSFENPFQYERANVAGHLSVLEACRRAPRLEHLVYASSSSVYGHRVVLEGGFREDDPVDRPVSLYAATKRACELMSTSYAGLYRFSQTGLRFFSVYGPWGRPDMAYFSFTQRILSGQPLEVFGDGRMARDFTFIDDAVDGVIGVLDHPPGEGEHRIFNVGNSRPVALMDMIMVLEHAIGRKAKMTFKPMQAGDVGTTCADVSRLNALTGYLPTVSIKEGLPIFVAWYRDVYSQRN